MHRNPRPAAGLSLGGILVLLALLLFSWLQGGELSIPTVVLDQATATPVRAATRATAAARPTERPTEQPTAEVTAAAAAIPAAGETATRAIPARGPSGLPAMAYADLPPQAHDTIVLIDQGGPYPFRQDDGIFQNREGILPAQARGYYREYTVITPGEDDRGARRIVAGSGGELFYTDDHYDSFREVIR